MLKKMLKNKRIRNITLAALTFLFFVTLIYIVFAGRSKTKLEIKHGVWDSFNWYKEQNSITNLNGEWEFYWKKLLYHVDFEKKPVPDAIVTLPSVWNQYKIKGKNLQGLGYATFRCHVKNAVIGKTIAMRISPLSTAYRMYIDDQLIAENGIVGTDKKSSRPEYRVEVIEYTPNNSNYDIILQVSNFTNARGGVCYIPQIGLPEELKQLDNLVWYRDSFLVGCFIFMLFLSLSLYFLQPSQKSKLYFSIMCICIIIRTIIYGSYIITSITLLSNINVIVRMDYLSVCWFIPALLMLTNSQFKELLPMKIIKINYIEAITFTVFISCTSICVFTKLVYFLELIDIIMIVFTLYLLCRFRKREKDRYLFLFSLAVFFLCGIHDLLLHNNYISGGSIEYMPIGFLLFLIGEEILIAKTYSATQKENERNFIEIETMNQREREIEIKFLKSQIKPDFIHNALNTIISVSRKNPEEARELLVEFSRYLRNCFEFENLEYMIPLEKEIEFVHSYLAIEKARFGESLNIIIELEDIQIMIPPLIIQPLVENAVIHGVRKSNRPGEIKIYIRRDMDSVLIGVMDNGTGIEKKEIDSLLYNAENQQGIGLQNINQRLNKIYGINLVIEGIPAGGTNIFMNLPLEIN